MTDGAISSPTLTAASARGQGRARVRTSLFWMVVVALALRLGYIAVGHTYRFHSDRQHLVVRPEEENFDFGFEMGRIARSVAEGQGFSNPFHETTGSTAWEPPLYPYLMAAVFQVFGVYNRASAIVLLSINSVLSALTCIPIFLIAKRCFDERVAVWASWSWALLPPVIFWCTRWVWETSLAALLLALIFWLTLRFEDFDLRGTGGLTPWVGFGLLWGVSGLTNNALLSFLPASGLWIWYRRARAGKRSITGVGVASLVFAAAVAPWLVRNYEFFGRAFLRSNFGAELRLGNGPGADGTWMDYLHPSKNLVEAARYRTMGELAYVDGRKREAVDYIREDPARFAGISLKRFVYYWAGLPKASDKLITVYFGNALFLASSVLGWWGLGRALRKRRPGAWLYFWLMLFYPLAYYFVFALPRYRHPIEPELLILIVYVISEAKGRSIDPREPTTLQTAR